MLIDSIRKLSTSLVVLQAVVLGSGNGCCVLMSKYLQGAHRVGLQVCLLFYFLLCKVYLFPYLHLHVLYERDICLGRMSYLYNVCIILGTLLILLFHCCCLLCIRMCVFPAGGWKLQLYRDQRGGQVSLRPAPQLYLRLRR